jgi:uncharacterized protein YbjT (DUF2867 family)
MKMTVFGATGGIGGQIVRQALDAGHKVTAVVRDPARLSASDPARLSASDPALEVVTVPGLTDPEALRPALAGSAAVLSGVGPRTRKAGPVASSATHGILQAMRVVGVSRFVAVSAVPVGPVPAGESWVNRRLLLPLISALLREVYADLTVMEEEIAHSDTEWTVVRPPRLVDRPLSGRYRTVIGANVPRGYVISRADVAHAMLAALGNPAAIRQAVGVAN